MRLLDTILVATDLGPAGSNAVKTAVGLANVFDSKILLLHVVPERVYQWIADGPGIPELERRLSDTRLHIRAQDVSEVEVIIGRGSPSAAICETAAVRDADLIVLNANSASEKTDVRLGTVAERVIRRASAPVWLARPSSPETPGHILCPVDVSDASRRALKNAHHLSRKFHAKLTVLHVLEPISTVYNAFVMPGAHVDARFLSPQKLHFDEFLAHLDFRDANWIKKTRTGKPHEQILAEVKESAVDLVVMGTVGKGGVTRFLMGSVTQKVTRELTCALLTMKAQDMIRLRMDADLKSLDECLGRGRELLEGGFATDAIREFDRCLVVSPTLATAWDGKSQAYEQLGDSTGAAQARENAKRIRDRLLRDLPELGIHGKQ